MKLVGYGPQGAEQAGILIGDEIVPLAPALHDAGLSGMPLNVVLGLWTALGGIFSHAVAHGRVRIPLDAVRLGAPVPHPRKIIGVGLNYHGYVGQVITGSDLPVEPVLFLKPHSAVAGPFDDIVKPFDARDVEPELEIGVVIGKAGHRISQDRAMEHVFGFVACNDVTARDVFIGESTRSVLFLQAARGKGFPGFCPMGPWLATRDEAPDLDAFSLSLSVNGELRQAGSSQDMIFSIPQLVSSASAAFGLLPGDLLLTGSPPRRKPQNGISGLHPGDTMRCEITGLGEMAMRIIDEPLPTVRSPETYGV